MIFFKALQWESIKFSIILFNTLIVNSTEKTSNYKIVKMTMLKIHFHFECKIHTVMYMAMTEPFSSVVIFLTHLYIIQQYQHFTSKHSPKCVNYLSSGKFNWKCCKVYIQVELQLFCNSISITNRRVEVIIPLFKKSLPSPFVKVLHQFILLKDAKQALNTKSVLLIILICKSNLFSLKGHYLSFCHQKFNSMKIVLSHIIQ